MLPGVYYYYPVTSIGKHTHYTVRDYNTRHTRASTALSAAVALMSRAAPGCYTTSYRRPKGVKSARILLSLAESADFAFASNIVPPNRQVDGVRLEPGATRGRGRESAIATAHRF